MNETEVASRKKRVELLRGATVYTDLGNRRYAEVLDQFLAAATGSGVGKNSGLSPFTTEMRGRIHVLNIEHRADIIEATLARLRDRFNTGDSKAGDQLHSLERLLAAVASSDLSTALENAIAEDSSLSVEHVQVQSFYVAQPTGRELCQEPRAPSPVQRRCSAGKTWYHHPWWPDQGNKLK